jgi:hypothetical protein
VVPVLTRLRLRPDLVQLVEGILGHETDARVFEVEGVPIPTASIDHLIASKQTGGLQDAADVEVLKEIKRMLQERESLD